MIETWFSVIVGLLFTVLSYQIKTGVGQVFTGIAAAVFLIYAAAILVMKYVAERQAAKLPPFSLGIQMNFKSPEERSTFGDRLNVLLQDFRREQDATNGLNEAQLADAGMDKSGEPLEGQSDGQDVELEPETKKTEAAKSVVKTPAKVRVEKVSPATEVKVGQIYRDNDPRFNHIVRVVRVDNTVQPAVAYMVNTVSGRKSHIVASRLLKTNSHGYTYEGMTK